MVNHGVEVDRIDRDSHCRHRRCGGDLLVRVRGPRRCVQGDRRRGQFPVQGDRHRRGLPGGRVQLLSVRIRLQVRSGWPHAHVRGLRLGLRTIQPVQVFLGDGASAHGDHRVHGRGGRVPGLRGILRPGRRGRLLGGPPHGRHSPCRIRRRRDEVRDGARQVHPVRRTGHGRGRELPEDRGRSRGRGVVSHHAVRWRDTDRDRDDHTCRNIRRRGHADVHRRGDRGVHDRHRGQLPQHRRLQGPGAHGDRVREEHGVREHPVRPLPRGGCGRRIPGGVRGEGRRRRLPPLRIRR